MRPPHPRGLLGALAVLAAALILTAPPTSSSSTTRITLSAAPTNSPAAPRFELASAKAADEQLADDILRWKAAAAPKVSPTPAPPTTIAAPTTTVPPPPDPEPAAEVAEVPGGSAADAVRQFFPDNFAKAWRVTECESGHDPSAVSAGGGNWGLFQINYVHSDAFEAYTGQPFHDGVLDPYANAKYARHLYDESGGWGPWSCRNA